MLKKEFQYYLDNQAKLLKKYNGRFIVLVGDQVVGDYESNTQAYSESIKRYALGTFLIQRVSEGDTDYSQTFHSRVIINQLT